MEREREVKGKERGKERMGREGRPEEVKEGQEKGRERK